MSVSYDCLEVDFGTIYLAVDGNGVCKIAVSPEDWHSYSQMRRCQRNSYDCHRVIKELTEYFRGERQQFTVPISVGGTPFARKVWQELCAIPYGQIRTYSDIAVAVGKPKACRAVGQANFSNPLPIIIPCHRVVGKDGRLTGYKGANIHIKKYLLELETRFRNGKKERI